MASNAPDRDAIALQRLVRILGQHVIANARTLEQKISDAGPKNQRIDPHVLTRVRASLIKTGTISVLKQGNVPWYHLSDAPEAAINTRLKAQLHTYQAITDGALVLRLGQTLEIATYRALCQVPNLEFFGRFKDLEDHDDSTPYSKEEPPQHIGALAIPGKGRLDFIVRHNEAGSLGLECKNIREWLYPDRPEIKDALRKCLALNCVPVIISRRIPFVTFKVLSKCGVIIHQNFNQLFPQTDAALASQAKHKDFLAYHDIRTGNQADARLAKFIGTSLHAIAPAARARYEEYKDLLDAFSSGEMDYQEFAGRARRRSEGANEDHDWEEEEE